MKKFSYIYLVIIAAFAVRAAGIQFGLPFIYHDDEPIVVNYALAYGTGDFNPHFFNIAPLLTYLLFFIYGIFFLIGRVFGCFHTLKDFAYLYLNDPTIFYIIGRGIFGLICGTISVAVLYILGKKYFGKNYTGPLAALFLAFNFLHARDSHYVYFDIPLTLCVLIFFLKAHDFFMPARRKDYIQLGLLLALAISVKYQGVSLLAPFLAIVLYNLYLSKNTAMTIKAMNLIWCGAAFFAVMFICNPFLFLNIPAFITKAQRFPYMPVPLFYHLKVSLFNGCGVLMVIFGVMGMAWALIRRKDSIIIGIYAVFYYLLITRATQGGERLALPIVPFILLFAAFLITEIYNAIKNKRLAAPVSIFLSVILLYPSLINTFYSDMLFMKEDTRTQAYKWIKENIGPKSRIALDATASWFPRLEKDREQIKELKNYFGSTSFSKPANAEQTKLKFMLDDPLYPDKTYYLFYLRGLTKRGFLSIYPCISVKYSQLQSNRIDYAVLSSILVEDRFGDFVKDIEAHSDLLKTFSPYKEGVSRIRPVEMASGPAAAFMEKELRERKNYGPYIKIYKIKK